MAVSYSLQYAIHNGRCFLGPFIQAELSSVPQLGSMLLEVTGKPLILDWVLEDVMMVVVMQVVATPKSNQVRSRTTRNIKRRVAADR